MTTSATENGRLFVVATPIGNKNDITLRALEILKTVGVILAEDTRHSLQLLNMYGIKKPLQSLHEHNEQDKAAAIIAQLKNGENYALLSDAGTPLISDPGYILVNLAQQEGIQVVPIPGACAFITALQAAGVACDALSFFGFLPAKSTARVKRLEELSLFPHSLLFYESTHRIISCIEDIGSVFGSDTLVVIAKELTKRHENIIRGQVTEVLAWLQEEPQNTKGEFVVIIPPRVFKLTSDYDVATLHILLDELPLKQAVKLAAKIMHKPKNELYQIALQIKGDA